MLAMLALRLLARVLTARQTASFGLSQNTA